jgi:putative heme iron utilization protein
MSHSNQQNNSNEQLPEGMKKPFKPSVSNEKVLKEFHEFNQSFDSVILGTVNKEGQADTSYAPLLRTDGRLYIYISELAVHTANLLHQHNASLMFIEPEDSARNLFKRQRSTIRVDARTIARGCEEWVAIMDSYSKAFGTITRNLYKAKDFHLFELQPQHATYVRGFAQAYNIYGEKLDQITHKADRGHGEALLDDHGEAVLV